MLKSLGRRGLVGALIIILGIQVIPYGHSHTNPRLHVEPVWDSPETRKLAVRACYDCHSNETIWPWYSYVAPFSWLMQRDVDGGRKKLNYSKWNHPQEHARQSAKMVREGTMPQWYYVPFHPRANLSSAETQSLIRGLVATFGGKEREEEGEEQEKHKRRS